MRTIASTIATWAAAASVAAVVTVFIAVIPALQPAAPASSVAHTAEGVLDPVCASLRLDGSVIGPRTVGPVCQPYSDPVLCHRHRAALGTLIEAEVTACHPW